MDDVEPIPVLVQQLRGGSDDAAEKLFARYAQRLTRLAEQHLSRKLAGRLDGEDVVQSVFRTFFRRCARGDFQIDSSAQIWRLLVKITVAKARAQGRYHSAARRNVAAEQDPGDGFVEAVTEEPGPEEAADLVDQIEALLRGLPELHCRVLERRLEGHSVADIAAGLGVSRQSVYRILDLLQQRLSRSALSNPD